MLSLRLTSLVFCLALITSSATANQLPAGSGPLAPDAFSLTYTATTASFKPDSPFDTGSIQGDFFTGILFDANNVYCSGCIDIVFQVEVFHFSTASVSRITIAGYTGYQTDVGYDLSTVGQCGPADGGFCGSDLPDSVDRLNADEIGFNFTTGGGIGPDMASVALVIETDAKQFTDPGISFFASDGTSALNLGGAFGPAGPPVSTVPEPSAGILLGLGLLGLLRRFR